MTKISDVRRGQEQFRIGPRTHAVQIFLVRPEKLAVALLTGNPEATTLMECISRWFKIVAAAHPKDRPLCMACDTKFLPHTPPQAFIIQLPAAHKAGTPLTTFTTGVCRACSTKSDEDLLKVTANFWGPNHKFIKEQSTVQ